MGEVKVGGTFLDPDQLAADERCERGTWDFETAQFGDGQFAIGAGQLGQDSLLVIIELGEADALDQDGIAHGALCIARLGSGFAGDPLLTRHAGKQTRGGAGLAAELRIADSLSGFERIQNGVLAILLIGAKFRAARRALLGSGEEGLASGVGDPIQHLAADFAGEGQHGTQHFTDRREVVLRDPLPELHQLRGEDRLRIEDGQQRFCFDGRRFIVQAQDHAGELLVAERDQDARTDGRHCFFHSVGEEAVQRDRHGDVAKGGHVLFRRVPEAILNPRAAGRIRRKTEEIHSWQQRKSHLLPVEIRDWVLKPPGSWASLELRL